MVLRMFVDGRISPLLMSGTGDGAAAGGGAGDGAGGGAGGGSAAAVVSFDSSKPFAEQLPEKYRADPSFRDIKSVDALLDSFTSAQRMIGADKATILQMPKDDDAAAWNGLYNRLGRPEAADKYNLGKRADGSDYGDADKAMHAKLLPVLHEAGLTQRQLDKIRPTWDAMVAEASGAGTKAAETYASSQIEGLKKDWGAKFDENMADAQAAIQHLGDKDLIAELNIVKDGKATGDNAGLLRMMAKIGAQLREDGVLKGGVNTGGTGAMEPAAAKAEITRLENDPEFKKAWLKKDGVGTVDGKQMTHAEAIARRTQLFEYAYPDQAA